MVTVSVTGWPTTSVPLDGLKPTPGRLLDADADHTSCPCEPDARESVMVHVQPPFGFAGQVVVFTVTTSEGAAQLQPTGSPLPGVVTSSVALAGQTPSGMATVVVVDWPGGSEPFGGVNVMPLIPLLDVPHGKATWLVVSAVIDRGQLQPVPAV